MSSPMFSRILNIFQTLVNKSMWFLRNHKIIPIKCIIKFNYSNSVKIKKKINKIKASSKYKDTVLLPKTEFSQNHDVKNELKIHEVSSDSFIGSAF